jgi:hypothetical protein
MLRSGLCPGIPILSEQRLQPIQIIVWNLRAWPTFCGNTSAISSANQIVFRLTRLKIVNFVRQSWLSKLTPNFVNQFWRTKLKIYELRFVTNFTPIRPVIFSKQNWGVSFDQRVLSSIRKGLIVKTGTLYWLHTPIRCYAILQGPTCTYLFSRIAD